MNTARWSLAIASLALAGGLFILRPAPRQRWPRFLVRAASNAAAHVPCTLATLSFFQSCGSVSDPSDPCGVGGDPSPGDSGVAPICSPVLLDLSGNGFFLTDASHGVRFDISGSGKSIQIAWTAAEADNAFLALDRNGNGVVDNGTELFGNFTPQPSSPHPNGFLALAVYDQPEHGGNGDGIIDARDQIFSSLRLWLDSDHDGVCQPDELHTLPSEGVISLSLNYHASLKRDSYGNLFRYRARVNPRDRNDTSEVGRTAYDIFLTTAPAR